MPSLFRFLFVVTVVGGLVAGGLYGLSNYVELPSQEVSKPVPGVKIKR